jgi:hypothetical protein
MLIWAPSLQVATQLDVVDCMESADERSLGVMLLSGRSNH